MSERFDHFKYRLGGVGLFLLLMAFFATLPIWIIPYLVWSFFFDPAWPMNTYHGSRGQGPHD